MVPHFIRGPIDGPIDITNVDRELFEVGVRGQERIVPTMAYGDVALAVPFAEIVKDLLVDQRLLRVTRSLEAPALDD
jgi:hypothetical protein